MARMSGSMGIRIFNAMPTPIQDDQMAEKSSLSEEIFNVLKARIIRWEYPPAHRLTEDTLCAEFGVSRVPVREALHMLVENNLVDRVPHRGCSVKQPNLQEIHELYEVRLALELYIVDRLATDGIDPEVAQTLEQTWRTLLQNGDPATLGGERLARLDETFHETLAASVGNQSLLAHLRLINERLFFTRMTDITTVERLMTTCRQHLEILQYIAQRNRAAVCTALQTNIDFGRHNVESALKETLARAYLKTAPATPPDPRP
jgi:DNA-binding GntR family transcriptional regulator